MYALRNSFEKMSMGSSRECNASKTFLTPGRNKAYQSPICKSAVLNRVFGKYKFHGLKNLHDKI